MSTTLTWQNALERLAVGTVAIHAIVAGIHGAAHVGAPVENTPEQWVFVITVITIMPLVGAALLLRGARSGAWWLLIGMATGKSRAGIRSLFDTHELEQFFDTIWCADDGPGKPHPFMVEMAMDSLGVEPDSAVMIGDAIHDIAMGRAAGVRTLGVSWGFGAAHELEAAGAEVEVA